MGSGIRACEAINLLPSPALGCVSSLGRVINEQLGKTKSEVFVERRRE